jgi:hypothetical protein
MNIDPASLTARIISVREQIAREWVDDIGILVQANNMILQSYFDLSKTARDQEKSKSDVEEKNKRQHDTDDSSDPLSRYSNEYTRGSDSSGEESNTAFSSSYSDKKSKVAFERTSRAYMNDMDSYSPVTSSPFRKGNFDLLLLLLTQESIHRVLRGFQDAKDADERVHFEYLREFYAGRLRTFFDGNQPYGRADDFIEELLLTSPLVKTTEDGKGVGLVDPLYLAKKIIHMRNDVAQDWTKIVRNVPEEHKDIRNAALTRQMQSTLEREIMTTILEESKTAEGSVGFE